jgi:1,4-alpha-glucan branching enzyme
LLYSPPDGARRDAFHNGTSHDAYRYLGAHTVGRDSGDAWHFAVWAPRAAKVAVTGEFCQWDTAAYPMQKQFDGTWELRLPQQLFTPESDPGRFSYPEAAERLTSYKYAVWAEDGSLCLKADPYALRSELRPNTASRLYDEAAYAWGDSQWMAGRADKQSITAPINIYEVHLSSWRRGEGGRLLSYGEIAEQLVPYALEMGYTHVELMPVMEHPLDMSWGYQVTGFYAPTARYGSPAEFKAFVDTLHRAGIGVLLDWVPAHFPRDEAGLRRFDGSACYEHEDARRAEMRQWGTLLFDFARGEARSFLLSNACFWLGEYHADGLRCDAVSGMLYHDFCREDGQWLPNRYGGRENLDAIDFLKTLNTVVYREHPGVMMIAEEASAYPQVTGRVDAGGLGFGYKWNMGWMNDVLSYVKHDPVHRKWHHDKITFPLMYAFSENYILPFSHDEVVHGKRSMLDKQPGDLWQKFAGLRALYGYTMAHPGKKLLFMGQEFAHFIEWKYDDQLDWFLLRYQRHPELRECVKKLNFLYRETPALHEVDGGWEGFEWTAANDRDNSVFAFIRTDKAGARVLCAVNFTPRYLPEYRMGLPAPGTLREFFNTDDAVWGGSGKCNPGVVTAVKTPWGGFPWSAQMVLPPLACVYFTYTPSRKKNRPDTEPASTQSGPRAGIRKEG